MKTRPILLSLLLALVTTGFLPATVARAQTDPVYQITGSGWGHGVGMSQYGARAMAEAGWTADQILTYYYSGVNLQPIDQVLGPAHWLLTDPDPLWIGLAQNRSSIRFHVDGGSAGLCKANDNEGPCPTQFANQGESWEFRALGGGLCQFFRNGSPVGNPGTCRASIEWGNQPNVQVTLEDLARSYARGTIRIRPVGNNFNVSLEIGLEEYLYGLGEMPSSWPDAALQAQAIAARTYAVRQALRWGPESAFDPSRQAQCWCQLYATVVDQNYVGWSKESTAYGNRWVAAVQATAGRIITHPQAPESTVIIAYYSSSSGGYTDSNVAGLGHSTLLPYLPGVSDPWSVDPRAQNPFATWTANVTASQIASAVGLDTVTGVAVTERNPSGSVAKVAITGTLGGVETTLVKTGRAFKAALGLRSITFDIQSPAGSVLPDVTAGLCDEPAPAAGFTDVAEDSVHAEDIDCVSYLGVIPGVSATSFNPSGRITRREMALFLVRAADRLGVALPDPIDQGFTDIGALTQEERDAVNRLAILGITKGTGPATYSPDRTIDRWQMAIFLTRLHATAGYDLPTTTGVPFKDLAGYPEETVRAVTQLYSLGVTKGTSATTFSPTRQVTREQMASFLARLIRIDT